MSEQQDHLPPVLEEMILVEPMLQFFRYAHLPARLQDVSRQFASLAVNLTGELPRNAERTAGLRKLVEAKDCAVRAMLYQDPQR